MGILRFIFAISVVIVHSSPVFGLTFVGALIAVQSFYIISGFYMALILNEKYNSYALFLTNRFLRLFPAYWAVLILTFLISLVSLIFTGDGFQLKPFIQNFNAMNVSSLLFMISTNILIFGQDIVMFMKLNAGHLGFTPDFLSTEPKVYHMLFIPQAWTLGVELSFYLIAPFLVKRKAPFIALLIIISLILRGYLHSVGLYKDPWNYRFFPTELAFFLAGSLAYKFYHRFKLISFNRCFLLGSFLFIFTLTLFFQYIPISLSIKKGLYYGFLFLCIPIIFKYSKEKKFDCMIGELSYPIYISHYLIILLLEKILLKQQQMFGIIAIILTVSFSILLVRYVVQPIDFYRQRRASQIVESHVTQHRI